VEPFYALRAKVNTKPNIVHDSDPIQDTITPWEQLEEAINDLAKNETLMMNKITNLEREQKKAPKPPLRDQPQNTIQAWRDRPSNEKRVPNNLYPSNVISQ
jgi:hypothetical protein